MADGTEPLGLAMVVCDAIHVDLGTGKRTLLGLFTTIYSREFPTTVPAMAIYVSITECRGKVPCFLQIIDVNEEHDPVMRAPGEIDLDDPLAIAEIDMRLGGVVFPEPGEYRVQFQAAGSPILERRITLIHVPTPENTEDE